jgi:hypothetical protein
LLSDVVPLVDRDQARRLDAQLALEEHDREPLRDVYARDYAYDMTAFGWLERLAFVIQRQPSVRESTLIESENRTLALLRLLRADLAIRGYRRDVGNFPPSLESLVPGWLEEVPVDPFSGHPLIYRADAEGYLVYSVGQDEIDDGGIFDEWVGTTAQTDLSLDTYRLFEIAEQQQRGQAAANQATQAAPVGDDAATP